MKLKNIFKKQKKYTMDMDSANDTLQNVFAALDKEPNTVPFDKIVLRQKANTFSTSLCKYTSILMIILLLVIPFFTLQIKARIDSVRGDSHIYVIDHYIDTNSIHLTLESDNYYYPSCYAIDARGHRYLPTVDCQDQCRLIFDYTGVKITVYISDNQGEYYQFIVTPNKEK